MTDRARRRLEGEEVDDDDDDKEAAVKPPRVRLRKDGKPWRGRKRRASEDIKRDQLVEQLLHENRRGYNLPQLFPPSPPPFFACTLRRSLTPNPSPQ